MNWNNPSEDDMKTGEPVSEAAIKAHEQQKSNPVAYDNAKFERERNKEKRQQIKLACLEAALRAAKETGDSDIIAAAKAFYAFVRT